MRTETSSAFISRFPVRTKGGAEPPKWLLLHPSDVVDCEDLSAAEKRAILASWASDERAVEDAPALRRLESGAIVSVDEILQALKAIDRSADNPGDDDPPPAGAARALRLPRPIRVRATSLPLAAA